jgi:hypothetical protein
MAFIAMIAAAGIVCSSLVLSGCTAKWSRPFWVLVVSEGDQANTAVHVGYYAACYQTIEQKTVCVDHGSLNSSTIGNKASNLTVTTAFDFAKASIRPIYHMLSLILFVAASGLGIYTAYKPQDVEQPSGMFTLAFWVSMLSAVCAWTALAVFTLATRAIVDSHSALTIKSGYLIEYFHILQFALSLGLPLCAAPKWTWKRLL